MGVKNINDNRNYGIDCLRVLAMLMITTLHVIQHGGILEATNLMGLSVKHFAVVFIEILVNGGVDVFALISGYVGYGRKIDYSRIIELTVQVLFYTIPVTVIVYFIKPELVNAEVWIRAIIPFACETYWYYSAYFVLFFFIPYLNEFLEKTDKKVLLRLLMTMLIILSLLPTLTHRDFAWMGQGYKFPWLVVMYLLGGVIKKYKTDYNIARGKPLICFWVCIVFTWIWDVVLEIITTFVLGEPHFGRLFIKYTSPTIVMASASLLLSFSTLETNNRRKWIARNLAPLTFGVYLVHTEPLIRELFTQNKFIWVSGYNVILMVGFIILLSIGIFCISLCVDYCRKVIFKLVRVKASSEKLATCLIKLCKKHFKVLYD